MIILFSLWSMEPARIYSLERNSLNARFIRLLFINCSCMPTIVDCYTQNQITEIVYFAYIPLNKMEEIISLSSFLL